MEKQQKNKRTFLLVLPLLVLPLLALAFWTLGGGRNKQDSTTERTAPGINTKLPAARFKKEKPKNKLDFYEQAGKDTAGRNTKHIREAASRIRLASQEPDRQTQQINKKLEQITREINRQPETPQLKNPKPEPVEGINSDVDRLETLMKNMQQDHTDDPEIKQLNEMLNKILAIQHPEQVKEQSQELDTKYTDSLFKAIPAVIAESGKVVEGASVKLRLLDNVLLNGQLIPKNHLVYGLCNISNQRLLLEIKTIRLGTSIIPVNLTLYGMDGMPGIEAPEAVLTKTVNSGAADALSGLQVMSYDPSLATQAAAAGIDAAKRAVSKKVRRVKVKLKAGMPVLLRNNDLRRKR